MSRPRYWWYGNVKRMIIRSDGYKHKTQSQYVRYTEAIKKALEDTRAEENGEKKVKAVELVLINHTHTSYGASAVLYYSEPTVKGWISAFVYKVAAYIGLEGEESIGEYLNEPHD